MKFDMGSTTLNTLTKRTQGSSDELTTLLHQLVDSVAPLQGNFNGAGRAAFDNFKSRVDEVAHDLNQALAMVNQGQGQMDLATQTGDQDFQDTAQRHEGSAAFDSARFSSIR
ncbi:WXG100 family type VII secretion target [Nesterenkonia flava]|uniref:WXG100 family type VII secretion target n=1 Tax=Nesterenkonia flava TaxID=469799 RepID=A0ABU1FQM6_9MICC|nr:WXG100 family type VII secretion target [Nesterenkonia flava]MDR5710946.1 WXG100 family type VII secretion target [Nesterenkonia flava]